MVGLGRIELPTSPLSGVRSSQLSYRPGGFRASHTFSCAERFRNWWSWSGSNRRPPECKSGALPAELQPLKFEAAPFRAASKKIIEADWTPPDGTRPNRQIISSISEWRIRDELYCRPIHRSKPDGLERLPLTNRFLAVAARRKYADSVAPAT